MNEKLGRGCVIGLVVLAAFLMIAMMVLVGFFLRLGWNIADQWISN